MVAASVAVVATLVAVTKIQVAAVHVLVERFAVVDPLAPANLSVLGEPSDSAQTRSLGLMLLQVSLALLAPFLTCQTFHGELVCHFPLLDTPVVLAADSVVLQPIPLLDILGWQIPVVQAGGKGPEPLVDILVVQAAPVLQGTKHFRLLVVPVVVAPDPKPRPHH